MSDPLMEHPDSEQLVTFAEGRSANARAIEDHLDTCPSCAEAVLIARQVVCLSEQKLIPALSPPERILEKERLRALFKLQPLQQTAGTRENPRSKPGTSTWASLGAAVGTALGMGHSATGPKPVVAGHGQPAEKTPAHPGNSGGHNQNGEIIDVDSASTQQGPAKTAKPDELSQLLDQMGDILGVDPTTAPQTESPVESSGDNDPGLNTPEADAQVDQGQFGTDSDSPAIDPHADISHDNHQDQDDWHQDHWHDGDGTHHD